MIDYLKLIVFPSKSLDKLKDKPSGKLTLYLISTVAILGVTLPKYIAESVNSEKGLVALMTYLIVMPLMYYPITYILGYCYYIVAKGFRGISSFVEMRNLVAYSSWPFILQFVISIPFITVGLLKNDAGLITHDNYITNLIFWLLSFRISMVGIAKYNKFNWAITIITWVIVSLPITGLAYLRIMLK